MRIHEILAEEQVDELNWRKGLAVGALALGALGGAQANDQGDSRRITVGPDGQQSASYAQQMAQQGVKPSAENPGMMPNQELDAAQKVEKTSDGIKIIYNDKEYDVTEVPADTAMVPRGAKKIKVLKSQLGFRSIGNFTAYLLPSGKAYLYSK